MRTTAATRPPINSTQARLVGSGDASLTGGAGKGYLHLLENTTLEKILDQPGLGTGKRALINSCLVHGELPTHQKGLDFLMRWLVQNQQAALLDALQAGGPLVVPVSNEPVAAGLLAVMQSGHSFFNLTLRLDVSLASDELNAIIPLLALSFQANASLTAIEIVSIESRAEELTPLFTAFASVKGLQLRTKEGLHDPLSCELIATLLSKNKTMRSLVLSDADDNGRDQNGAFEAASLANVIANLSGQLHLEHLCLSKVPRHSQASLGHFIGSSQSLTALHIGLEGFDVAEALVDGLRQTISVENLYLELPHLEDGMLPLIAGIANNKGSIKNVELTTLRGRVDSDDSACVSNLIKSSNFLVSLAWRFSEDSKVDLGQVGIALGKNERMELLLLSKIFSTDESNPYWRMKDWVDHDAVPGFIDEMKKNKTLTRLSLSEEMHTLDNHMKIFPGIQQVLDRNLAWRRYACSNVFIEGATEGLFASLQMPMDTAKVAAGFLTQLAPK